MPRRALARLRPRRRHRRVLVAIPGGEYGGAERYAVRIAAAAAQAGWEVAAAVRPHDALAPMRRDLHDAGVRVLRMVRGERGRELLGFIAMTAAYRPDVVHLTLPWPLAAGRLRASCALLGTPTVLVHQVVPDAGALDVRHAWLYRLLRHRRQHWVAVSAYGGAMLKRSFGLRASDEITVIHNAPRAASPGDNGRPAAPLDAGRRAAERDAARAALGCDAEAPVIVTVGRLAAEKGHDVLIDAAQRLASDWPGLRVLIAGDGAGRDALQQRIDVARLGDRVRLLGQVQDVAGLLAAADVFAFPSRREGTPFALLEAMSRGVPVVAARFGGADEIVDAGENGLLVAQDDPVGLAEAIAGLLRDPARARALAERGRERAAQFSEPVMIDATLDVIGAAARREART
jgi:glycosyltransferase involved in cell wall biosynthesis